jgi:hypothetical protein
MVTSIFPFYASSRIPKKIVEQGKKIMSH